MLSATIANPRVLRGMRFKPDPKTYRYLLEQLGREGDPASLVLVSGNPFEIVGAGKVGLETVGFGWGGLV